MMPFSSSTATDLRARERAALFVDQLALDLRALRPRGRRDEPGGGERSSEQSNACHRCLPEMDLTESTRPSVSPGANHKIKRANRRDTI